jgi:hypothetical protein
VGQGNGIDFATWRGENGEEFIVRGKSSEGLCMSHRFWSWLIAGSLFVALGCVLSPGGVARADDPKGGQKKLAELQTTLEEKERLIQGLMFTEDFLRSALQE